MEVAVRVIIIGGDHHNTLAVMRCFGVNKFPLKVYVHSDETSLSNVALSKSKFARGNITLVSQTEEALLKLLTANARSSKDILFPCSDFAEYVIDSNYSLLSNHYIIPGFKGQGGRVAYLMDKMHQFEYAEAHNIPMAKTWLINISKPENGLYSSLVYPCILKPLVSAKGNKSDIQICNTESELLNAITEAQTLNYEEMIIQQFLIKKFEVCAYGCLYDGMSNFNDFSGLVKKEREFPLGSGSTCLATFIDDEPIQGIKNRVLKLLYDEGYRGFMT